MLTKEKLQHHINHLQEKHEDLEQRLSKNPADYIATVLKKEKLQLKDEIEFLKLRMSKMEVAA